MLLSRDDGRMMHRCLSLLWSFMMWLRLWLALLRLLMIDCLLLLFHVNWDAMRGNIVRRSLWLLLFLFWLLGDWLLLLFLWLLGDW